MKTSVWDFATTGGDISKAFFQHIAISTYNTIQFLFVLLELLTLFVTTKSDGQTAEP